MYLLSTRFRNLNRRMILPILHHGGKVALRESHHAVHHSLMQDSELMGALIHEAGLVPTALPSRYPLYPPFTLESFDGLITPFFEAVTQGDAKLARSMIEVRYLKVSDLTILPRVDLSGFEWEDYPEFKETERILDVLATTPPSLFTLTFVHVSDLLGADGDRRVKARQLGLPRRLQEALAFVPRASGRIFTENNRRYQASDSSDSEVDEFYDFYDDDFYYDDL